MRIKQLWVVVAMLLTAASAAAQTGTLMPAPKFTAQTDLGAPCNGCKLYSYEAGTTTPLATYSDIDLAPGHQNANPVVLDPAGRATVYLTPSMNYKFVLTTSAGASIWSQDDVPPTQSLNTSVVIALAPFYYTTVRQVSAGATAYCVQNGGNAPDQMIETTGASTFSVTLDALANCNTGRMLNIKALGTGVITIDADGAETIDGATTYVMPGQYSSVTIYKNGSGTWSIQ